MSKNRHSFSVYALIDPRTGSPRYIGKSTIILKTRLAQHIGAARRGGRNNVHHWIMELLAAGHAPMIRVLWEAPTSEGLDRLEMSLIALARGAGIPLLNQTAGGEGLCGHVHSEETRRKIAAALRGRKRPPEATAKMRSSLIGVMKGIPKSAEHRARISAARKGQRNSEEANRKNAIAHLGKTPWNKGRKKEKNLPTAPAV